MKSLLGPVTVNINCGPPAAVQVGLIEPIVGAVPMVITRSAVAVLQVPAPLLAVMVTVVVRFACVDRKSTRLNSSHVSISYAVFFLKKKNYQMRVGYCFVMIP